MFPLVCFSVLMHFSLQMKQCIKFMKTKVYSILYFKFLKYYILQLFHLLEKKCDFNQTKVNQIQKNLKIKLIIFFVLSSLLMIFFWYFISCFCGVYMNTQVILIKDTLMSFGSSLIFPFILSFIPGCFRIPSLRSKKNLKLLYKISSLTNLLL